MMARLVSYIQRKFRVGIQELLELLTSLRKEVSWGHEGSKPRKVLITKEELDKMRGN